jgi:hypothetical protein
MKPQKLKFEDFNLNGKLGDGYFKGIKVYAKTKEPIFTIHLDTSRNKFWIKARDFDPNVLDKSAIHKKFQQHLYSYDKVKIKAQELFDLYCTRLKKTYFK